MVCGGEVHISAHKNPIIDDTTIGSKGHWQWHCPRNLISVLIVGVEYRKRLL